MLFYNTQMNYCILPVKGQTVDTFHISLSRNVMCWVQMINFITGTELSEHVPKTFHECQKSKFMSINNFG